ncbi:MAG TPA: GNAT family N-acetyltransferase [Ilumatobacteraceae bacterium]|nr:GNAT family N-acetyltransferase [Ilumatobacteraceae bacterium]
MAVVVRRAEPSDLDVLLELAAEYCAADGHAFVESRARRGLEPMLGNDVHGTVWMIDDTDGYAVVTWSWSIEIGGFEVVLDELYVRTSGQGKGSTALQVVIDDCRRRGAKRIFLETERPNEAARRLYARHGFTVDDSIWMSLDL